jgi:ketosteroid isomerase-like protein
MLESGPSPSHRVQRILEESDVVAVKLEWTGILAVPLLDLPASSEMKAFIAIFLTFRDGRIVSQRSYDLLLAVWPISGPARRCRATAAAGPG